MEDEVTKLAPDGNKLHKLLIRACPPHNRVKNSVGRWVYVPAADGKYKSIAILASMLGMSAWGVQKWCKENHIPARRAAQIVDLSPETVSLADFGPFVYM